MNVDEQESNIEPNQNQLTVAGVFVPDIEPVSAVFKLDADCWDDVFDCLSVKDLYSFGQTCKTFQKLTGKYFYWKYEALYVQCKDDGFYTNDHKINGFDEFIQKMNVFQGELYNTPKRYKFIANCKTLKELRMDNFTLYQLKSIKHVLEKIEDIELTGCYMPECTGEFLSEKCVNLKRLRIDTNDKCLLHKYPALQHLKFGPTDASMIWHRNNTNRNNNLKIFFELNPSVRSFESNATYIWTNRVVFLKLKAKLDDFAVYVPYEMNNVTADRFFELLNKLHDLGFYKRLHLAENHHLTNERLIAANGLVSLFFTKNMLFSRLDGSLLPIGPYMSNLRELGMHAHNGWDMEEITNNCKNLQRLYICDPTIDDIRSFICRSVKLIEITARFFKGNRLNLWTLNNEREKLENARKVTIYVEEETYLATKWTTTETNYSLIELRRTESHTINSAHNFWHQFAWKEKFQYRTVQVAWRQMRQPPQGP